MVIVDSPLDVVPGSLLAATSRRKALRSHPSRGASSETVSPRKEYLFETRKVELLEDVGCWYSSANMPQRHKQPSGAFRWRNSFI